jgi:hypothetical protein
MWEGVDSMSQLFLTVLIKTVLEDWGQIHLLFASRLLLYQFPGFSVHSIEQKTRAYPPFFRNWSHKELALFEKSAETLPFFMNTALYPGNELTRKKVDSVVTTVIFFPNYFEYRLWVHFQNISSKSVNKGHSAKML